MWRSLADWGKFGRRIWRGYKDLLVLSLHGELSCPLQGWSGFSWQYQSVFMCRLWLSLHLQSPDEGWDADCICQPCFGWSQPACSQFDLCFPRKCVFSCLERQRTGEA